MPRSDQTAPPPRWQKVQLVSSRPDSLTDCEHTTFDDKDGIVLPAETRVCTNCGRLPTIPDSKKAAFAAACRLAAEFPFFAPFSRTLAGVTCGKE